ncbi:MAG: nucleotidyltransferase family protein [Acidobacteriota bacterium]|jgi:glucose-1-phosphate thymidylyltransferase|nr:nucleotidyltransferase family protein [Acidobacteriota bacterium]
MGRVEKAVIMARGLGTRMRKADAAATLDAAQSAAADAGVKAMIPIDRPFLDYVLSALADAGYKRACLVIGPEHHAVRDYFGVQSPPERIGVEFAIQAEPRGTADAVAAAERFADGGRFLLLNSDNYYPASALEALGNLDGAGVALFDRDRMVSDGGIPEERIGKFSVAEVGADGFLKRIHEKPSEETLRALPAPVLVNMNCWLFPPVIFEACRNIEPSPRGELELTAAVQYAIDALGARFEAVALREAVLDLSGRADIANVAGRLRALRPRP